MATDLIDGQIAALLVASFAADFILHASVGEFWIHATRRSDVPIVGEVKAV